MSRPDSSTPFRAFKLDTRDNTRRSWLRAGAIAFLACVCLRMTLAADSTADAKKESSSASMVAGICRDEAGKPLADVELRLLCSKAHSLMAAPLTLEEVKSDSEGRFRFERQIPATVRDKRELYRLIARKSGRASEWRNLGGGVGASGKIDLELHPSATVDGVVRDENGSPVEGAVVRFHGVGYGGIGTAVTDANGRYEISDLRPQEPRKGSFRLFYVEHKLAGVARSQWDRIPSTVDVELTPAGSVEGRVTDMRTRMGVPNVHIVAQGVDHRSWSEALTDDKGRYLLRMMREDRYNILVNVADRTANAIEKFEVLGGQTYKAVDLTLIEGETVTGKLVDAATGKAPQFVPADSVDVAWYGPDRPRSGAACRCTNILPDGTFQFRVPPGRCHPYFRSLNWEQVDSTPSLARGIAVESGTKTELTIRVRKVR